MPMISMIVNKVSMMERIHFEVDTKVLLTLVVVAEIWYRLTFRAVNESPSCSGWQVLALLLRGGGVAVV